MNVRVFKFGGASVKNSEAIKNICNIIANYKHEKLVVVISALGKTTNAMEGVVNAFVNNTGKAEELLQEIKEQHLKIVDNLFSQTELISALKEKIHNHFVEVDWLIEDDVMDSYEYIYDQIVSVGELASTEIVTAYLNSCSLDATWIDARDVIKTDRNFKEGKVDLVKTQEQVTKIILPLLDENIIVTQGFIGGTSDNETTTLGREGSDYTGAILSYCLDAKDLTIWKDVPGVLNADPRQFNDTTLLTELSYKEAVEQTYYGAKVIHPKTIKPLQNKGIPLNVRSFIDHETEGTSIHAQSEDVFTAPIIIRKENQVLMICSTLDFSFMGEDQVGEIMHLFAKHGIKINLISRGAIKFFAIVDDKKVHINLVKEELKDRFVIGNERDLELITIRHYNNNAIEELTKGREILVVQKSRKNYQAVLR